MKSSPEKFRNSIPVPALIVGKPGRLMDSLISIVKAHPAISQISTGKNLADTLSSLMENQSYLIFIDCSLSDMDILQSIQMIKNHSPEMHSLVIVETLQQYHQAISSSADDVLFRGFSTELLFSSIDHIISAKMQTAH